MTLAECRSGDNRGRTHVFQNVPAGLFDQLIGLNVVANVLLHVFGRFLKELQQNDSSSRQLELRDISKSHRHHYINESDTETVDNCPNPPEPNLSEATFYHTIMLRVTIYVANQMEPCCPRWLPPVEMLVAEVSNHTCR